MQPIAVLLARKATQRTARDRAATDRRELCRTSLALMYKALAAIVFIVIEFPSTVRAEPVEAWARWFEAHACGECGGRESPRRARYLFFASPKKSTQKKGDPQSATPSRCEGANLRRGDCGVRRVELALRLRRAARTTTASQFTRHGRFDAHAYPTTAPPQAQPAGGWAVEHPTAEQASNRTGLCCARPHLAGASASRCAGWAECSDGPNGCPIRGFPSVCAWGAQGAGWHVCRRTHMLRELTHRSCPSGAPQARSEFCGAPRDRAPQVAP